MGKIPKDCKDIPKGSRIKLAVDPKNTNVKNIQIKYMKRYPIRPGTSFILVSPNLVGISRSKPIVTLTR